MELASQEHSMLAVWSGVTGQELGVHQDGLSPSMSWVERGPILDMAFNSWATTIALTGLQNTFSSCKIPFTVCFATMLDLLVYLN